MKSKKKGSNNPISTQVAFVINTVKGDHLEKQCLLVSVNGHLFVLSPRTIQKRFRFYDSGFNLFIEPKRDIQISIAVFTPFNNLGYMHSFLSYRMQAPLKAKSKNIELHSYGNTYIISLSLFASPSFIYSPILKVGKRQASKKHSHMKKTKAVGQKGESLDFNPDAKVLQIERQKKLDDYDSSINDYSLNYSISPTESSSYINLDQEEDNSNNNQTKSFLLSQLSECSKTDETSTLCGSSSSD